MWDTDVWTLSISHRIEWNTLKGREWITDKGSIVEPWTLSRVRTGVAKVTTVWHSSLAVPLASISWVLLYSPRGYGWRGCASCSKVFLGIVSAAPGAGATNPAWVISIRPQRRENLSHVLMVGCRQTGHRVRKRHSRRRRHSVFSVVWFSGPHVSIPD